MTLQELANELENKYAYEEYSPIGMIETIQELLEDADLTATIEVGFGKDSSWREMGYTLHDFDYIRGWYADELPKEIAVRDFVVADVTYYEDKGKHIISVDFYGNPKTNQEREDEHRYENYWRKVREERSADKVYWQNLQNRLNARRRITFNRCR